MKKKVAIYARVSTEHEAQLSALDNQIQYYDNILSQHPNWELYDRYIDEGITGTSVHKRPNFMRMMKDAEDGCFEMIITREVSRFARNTVDTLQQTRALKKMGVEVYFTEDNIRTFQDDDGELKLTLMATLAQNESKKTSQRVKAGQKISFENGVFYGTGNILGYDKVGSNMVVNEEQTKIVKFIFEQFLKGVGTTKIKFMLEQRGYLTATGLSKWSVPTICRILQNPFYCGTIVYRKSYVPDFLEQKTVKNRGEVDKVVVEGTHEPIISKEDFEKAQLLIKKNSVSIEKGRLRRVYPPQNIWSKKLKCSCGANFNKDIYHRDDNNTTYCFRCYKQKSEGSKKYRESKGLDTTDSCDVKIIPEWKLQTMSEIIFNHIWNDKEKVLEILYDALDNTITSASEYSELESEIELYNKKFENNNNKLDKLLDLYLNASIEKNRYLSSKEEIEKQNSEIEVKIKELEKQRGIPKQTLKEKIDNAKKIAKENINRSNEKLTDDIIDNFVEYIKVYNDRFEWKLNFLSNSFNACVEGRSTSNNVFFSI